MSKIRSKISMALICVVVLASDVAFAERQSGLQITRDGKRDPQTCR